MEKEGGKTRGVERSGAAVESGGESDESVMVEQNVEQGFGG